MKLSYALIAGLSLIALPLRAASLADLTYTTTNGIVTITDCNDGATGELVIPDTIEGNPVTSIGRMAFRECTSLTSIIIPDSVTSIGDDAFDLCAGLTSVTIGNGVINIGEYAFRGVHALTNITIPDSVTSIGNNAFQSSQGLIGITIGNGVTSIGNNAFYGCISLTRITFLGAAPTVGAGAFSGVADVAVALVTIEALNSFGGFANNWNGLTVSMSVSDMITALNAHDAAVATARTAGQGDVTSDPASYSLVTQASYDALGDALVAMTADRDSRPTQVQYDALGDALVAMTADRDSRPTQVQYDALGDALVAVTADRDSRPTQDQYDALGDALVEVTADRDSRPTQDQYDALGDALVVMTADRDSRPTLAEVQDARVGSIVLAKDGQSGEVSLCFGLQKTDDFVSWEAFEGGTWSDAPNGEFKLTLPLAEAKKWLRLTLPE